MNYPFKVGQLVKIISKSDTPNGHLNFAEVIEKGYYGPDCLGRIKRLAPDGSIVVIARDDDINLPSASTGNFFLPQDLVPYFQAGDLIRILAKSVGSNIGRLASKIHIREAQTIKYISHSSNIFYVKIGGVTWDFLPTDLEWLSPATDTPVPIVQLTAKEAKLRFKQQLQQLI